MKHVNLNKLFAVFVAIALAMQVTLPSVALAEQRSVNLDYRTALADQATAISGIVIDGVEKPTTGIALDEKATVTAAGDISWEIPVIWVRDDLQMGGGQAEEGHTYLPALAFFVPQGYTLAQDSFTVTLSDSLTALFGTHEVISVYSETTGVTYIIPASLKDLFAQYRNNDAQDNSDAAAQEQEQSEEEAPDAEDVAPGYGDGNTLVEIHCSQTARDALTDEDLEWLIELIKDYLEPQAINLLLYNFGSFYTAAKAGELGTEIGLYIYYQKGDNDGDPDHAGIKGALAYVSADARMVNGELKYCYLLALDVDTLVKKDANGKSIRDPKTGKYTLVREGKVMETFRNTIVHEMFHALMDDYTRTGMSGATNLKDMVTDSAGHFPTKELGDRFLALQFPQWFIEGSASATEHVYSFRYDAFQDLRRLQGADGKFGTGELNPTFTTQLLIDNYVNGHNAVGDFRYYNLTFASGGKDSNDNEIETEASRYVTGYLATLYLCDLASRFNQNYKGSSIKVVDGVTTVDATKLLDGLNSLLYWLHNGNDLDTLIYRLAPRADNGTPIYKDTADFEELFIKGRKNADGSYNGDADSQQFVNTFLNYLLYLDKKLPGDEHPNGSILEDFDKRYTSLLDPNKKASSETLKIINSNDMTPSTVKSDTPKIGGGKSNPDAPKANVTAATTATASTNGQQGTKLPVAAKATTASEPEKKTEEEKAPLPAEVKADEAVEPDSDSEESAEQQTEQATEQATEQQDSSLPADEQTDEASDTTPAEQDEPKATAEEPEETASRPASENEA